MNQSERKEYRPIQSASGATSSSTTEEEEDEELALNYWDKWLKKDEELDDSEAGESDLEMRD